VLGNISTVAGQCSATGYLPEPSQATANKLGGTLAGLAVDATGNLYIADPANNRVRKVDTTGVITTIAGTGVAGFGGDNGPATSAQLNQPKGVAVDPATGNIYVADNANNRVRRFTPGGNIVTVVGTGTPSSTGDNGPGTSATINGPVGLAIDKSNNLYIAETAGYYVRVLNLTSSTITTIAGNGKTGGQAAGPALSTSTVPYGLTVSSAGVLYIAEPGAKYVTSVQSGTKSLVAGNGSSGLVNENVPPTTTSVIPSNVAFDSKGFLYLTDATNSRLRRVDLVNNVITTVAGNGNLGCTGDGGPALSAALQAADGLAIDSGNRIYVAQDAMGVVRAMSQTSPPASVSAVSGAPQSAAVATNFASPFVVVVKDSSGNGLGGITVNFAYSGGTVSPGTATTGSNGQAQTTVTASTTAGSYTVTGSVTGVSTPASGALTNLPGPPTLTFATQPSNTTAGAIINSSTGGVVVKAADSYGNAVSGITINLSPQGGSGTLSGATPQVTNSSGLATFSNLSINKTGTYTLQATDGTHFGTSASFVISPAATATITAVAGSGQSAALQTVYASQLQASVQDGLGNAIPNVSVTFSAPSSGASVTFSGPSVVNTNSSGVAAVTVTANNQIGSFQVTATTSGVSTPAVFNLSNIAGASSRLTFVQQPTNTQAGATIGPVSVQLVDSFGNNVPQAGVAVTLTTSPVTTISGTTTINTNTAGLATFANLSINAAGSYQLTATATSLGSAQSNSFLILAGVANAIQATGGTPQSATIYGPFAIPLSAKVTDSFGNPISGVAVSFSPPGSGASATLSALSANTDSTGQASVSATANAVVGSYTVTASANGVTSSASFALTNVAGVGANVVFTQQPASTTAGAVMAPVTVKVTDNGGNPAPGVTITLSAQGGSGVLSGATPVVTNASGLATFPNLSIDKTGTYSLQATDGTHFATSTSFVIGAGTASSITVVAGSGQSAPIGSFYASPLKASVQDALGNGVPGVSVTFSAPSSGPGVSFSGSPTAPTDNTGVAAVSVTANSQVGSFQVAATAPGISTPAIFDLTNISGTASRLVFVQQPADTPAGVIMAPVTVQITDNAGNNIALPGVAVTLSLNPVLGRLRAISGTTVANTDASGLATFSGLSVSAAGNYQLTASATSLASAQSNPFMISAGAPAAIQTVAGTPQSTTVLAPFAVPLQAIVTDSLGNPLSGVTVTFAAPATGASASLSGSTVTTDLNGNASVTAVANSTVGSYTVTASVSGVTPSASFTLTNLGGAGANLVFTAQPTNTAAGAVMAAVTVRLTDNGGNPVSGVAVNVTAQGGPGVLSGAAPVATDVSGLATFSNLSIDKTGTYSLQATDGTHFAASNSFVISAGTSASITVVAGNGQSAPVTSNYASLLKVSVQDALGNGIPNASVTFSAPGSGASVTFSGPPAVTTNNAGVASIPVAANTQVGSFQVTATAPGTPSPAVFSLTNVAGTASQLRFVQQPSNAQAGTAITPPITVQLTDNLGNPVAQGNVSVTLSLNPVVGRLPVVSGNTTVLTSASGLATFTALSIDTTGGYQFTALGTNLVSALSNAFTISGGAASQMTAVSGTPQSATVFAPFALPLQVQVTDSLNNPLPGISVGFTSPTSAASATLSASTATTDLNGLASITAVANGVVGSYTVTASAGAVKGNFALANLGGASAGLVFTQQPVNTPAGAAMPPVVARVTDSGGNPVSGVTIAISAQGGPGVLSGAVPVVTDSSGLATFSNLSIDKTGTYSLQVTDGTRFATSVSFVISPATSSSITVVAGNGQSTAVTTNYLVPLKVSVQDSLGNVIPGVAVTFTAPTSGASVTFLGSPTVTTDGAGIAGIFVTANSQVGAVAVTATASAGQAVFSLTNLTGAASNLKFVQQPSNAAAGVVISPPITVQLTDNLGNSVTQAGVAVTLSLNPAAGRVPAVSGPATVLTGASGLATFAGLSLDAAGSYQFIAIAPSLVSAQSNAFTISAGSPAEIQTISGTPQSTTVLAPFAVPLQVLVSDSLNNPLSGVSVAFGAPATGASASLSASTATTDANGHASVTAVANSTVGSYTVTASVSGVTPSASFALTNVGGGGANLVFTAQPANTAAGAVMAPITVRLTDNGGNPVSGVTVNVTAQGGPGALSGAAPVATDVSGLATFSNLSIDKTGTYSLQATDGTHFATSNSFVISAGTSASITVVAGNGQSAPVTANYASRLKVSVQDALGNVIPNVSVTFSAPAGGASATFSGSPTVTTNNAGVASIPVAANTQVGSFQVTATASGTPSPAVFSLTNVAGTASQLKFVQQPSSALAGAPIAPATVQLTDNLGNPVAQANVSVTLSLNPVVGRLPVVSGNTTVLTSASGLATFTGLSIDTTGSDQFTALGTSLVSALSNAFTISGGAPSQLTAVSGTPQNATVFAPFALPLQVLVTDSNNNPLTGVSVAFSAPATGAGASFSATTATTGPNGVASVSAVANGVVGSYTVTASAGGLTANFALTNLGGAGASLVFTQQPVSTAAGATMPPVVARVADNGGNPVSGVTVTITAQGGPGVLSGAVPVLTDASGLATFSTLSIDTAGTYVLQATDGTRFTTSVSFAISPATSSSITVVAGNGQSAAVTANYATRLKASVQDALGNGVPGVPVTFAAPASGASIIFSGPATVTTDTAGVASVAVTANTQVGSFQVTATASGIATPAVFSLTNVAGTASRLRFVQQPFNALAGAIITPPVTVQLTDNIGNDVAQSGVALTLSLNPFAGRLPAISGTTTVVTNSNGLATFAGLSIATAGNYQLTAVGPSLVSAQSVAFTISVDTPAAIQTVGGTPQSTTALAPFAVPLQVLVTDSFDNPLSGISVTFGAPGAGASATLSATTVTTDGNGYASVTATANAAAGSYAVTASVSGVTPSASFALTNTGGTSAGLVFTQQPTNTAAGAIIAPVVVRVSDNGGNPVGGVTISLTAQGGPGVLSGATPIATDSSGLATFSNLSIDKTGTYALQATDGTRFATSTSFLINPGTASSITAVAGSGQSAAIGAPYPSPLKASVQDALGNGVPGIQVTFAAPASGASVSFPGGSYAVTDSTGVAAVSVVANPQVGSFQVTATAPAVGGQAVFSLTNITGSANHLSFVQQPSNAQAGATITPPVTVQLQDSSGNNVAQAGISVALSLNPVLGRLRAISGTTVALSDSTGLATFSNLSISSAGNYQLTATGPSLSSAQSNAFRISPGPASTIQTIGGTPQLTIVLAPFPTPLQVLVADSLGNPLSGISVGFTAPATGASATLSASAVATDINGHASVTATANSLVGSYTVAASVSGVATSANFALTNVAGGGSLLSFTQQPVNTPAGSTMSPVVVRLTDSGGNPITNVAVAVALVGGGAGSLSGTLSVNTDTSGSATFSDLRIDSSGTYQLVASSGGVSAPSNSFQIGPAVGRTITVIEGNNQSAAAGDPYATTLKAVVRDGLGNAVPGAQVTFTAPVGGASVTFAASSTVTSAADGLATSPLATANSQPGLFNVVASSAGASAPVTFTLQNLSATASRMRYIQQPTDTVAGNPVTPGVAVQIVDRFGNPVPQAGVSINLLLSASTAVIRNITGATAQTDSSGLATFPNLTVTQAGTYQLLALATGFESSISASFQVMGGSPGSVSSAAGTPQSTIVRTIFAQPFVALVADAAGNPLSGKVVTFSAPASGASGTFSGGLATATATTDATGRATSAAFTANQTAGTFSVTAAVAGVSNTTAFALANLTPAAQTLAFITQPSNSVSGAVIGPPVRVQIQDGSGQPVNISGVAILMTLSQGTGSLSGTHVEMTDTNGIAVFNDLSVDLAGAKRLRALGSAQAAVDSNQFQISAGSAATIAPVSGGGQIANQSAQFAGPLQALVEDALGNPVSGVAVTFALPASGASGTFAGPATTQTDANGIATSPLITANNIQGVISATATAANLGAAQFVLAVIQPSGGSLRVNPTVTQFVQAFGGVPPSTQTATIVSISGSEIPWTAASSAPWLTLSPISGTTPSQITLSANGAGLAPGQYGALATVSDAGGNQQTIFVIFTITGATALVAQPSQLTFLSVVGSDQRARAASSQTIELTSANSLVPIGYQTTAQVQTPTGAKWLAVSPSAGVTPGAATVAVDPTGLLTGVFSGFVTFTPNDPAISPVSVPVTLVVGCGTSGCSVPPPVGSAVTNSASFSPGGSPSGVQTIFGSYLAASTQTATTFPLPTSLAGTTVLVDGVLAPLYYVSPSQINFQMPSATSPGSAHVTVMTLAGLSSPVTPVITAVQPGLYVYQNLRAKALNQDLTLHTPQTPIPAGGYVVLYTSGMGPTTPSVADGQPAPSSPLAVLNGSVRATVGGVDAYVQFAGLTPGLAGLIQMNIQIPAGLAPGDQPVFVTVNGVPTNAGLITVK